MNKEEKELHDALDAHDNLNVGEALILVVWLAIALAMVSFALFSSVAVTTTPHIDFWHILSIIINIIDWLR